MQNTPDSKNEPLERVWKSLEFEKPERKDTQQYFFVTNFDNVFLVPYSQLIYINSDYTHWSDAEIEYPPVPPLIPHRCEWHYEGRWICIENEDRELIVLTGIKLENETVVQFCPKCGFETRYKEFKEESTKDE